MHPLARAGVLRWSANGREVALFGVNYPAAFAYDYRAITALGIDPKRAIDQDVAQRSARGIKSILTPIAWWGTGYPAPDSPSTGFSNHFSKPQMAVDSISLRAQARYVAQFVTPVNPYTRRSYRDDPDVIAFEIFNEPWHDLSTPAGTTRHINMLVASMRGTGLRKPIFYNISEHFTPEHGRAVCAATSRA